MIEQIFTAERMAKMEYFIPEARRKKMMEKLKLTNLAELIKFAVREGLTSIDA